MAFPSDIKESEWSNYPQWNKSLVLKLGSVQLQPLEAKALHVVGTLVQIFEAAGYLLYCNPNKNRPYADYCHYAYLLACSAIELLGRCQNGVKSFRKATLKTGLKIVDLEKVDVNISENGKPTVYTYNVTKLVALRNLIAHGQGVASESGKPQSVVLHVELLDSFPVKLSKAFDDYYEGLFKSQNSSVRRQLAIAAVEPTLYSVHSGQVYRSPIEVVYNRIYKPGKKPSEVLQYTDWQIYKPERDKK